LTISRRLCQALGGEIVVSSVVGQGSAFTMRLPDLVGQKVLRGRGTAVAASGAV
ncbi:MAG: two-component sensor histidine kinase, partial [Roseiflexaceae bacterium]|nr:two-component sensor histidine kinase [Roseiflexaceae bacterium]